jgi:hypothetical protein
VRIVLVSADFSKEITTAVMWLRRQGLDIRCVRMQPFEHGKETLVHFAEIIPLPEARDYEVRLREQDQEARDNDEARKRHFERYWREFCAAARSRIPFLDGRNPPRTQWLSVPSGRPGISFAVVLGQSESRVECYIAQSGGAEANAATFQALCERKASIEGDFGDESRDRLSISIVDEVAAQPGVSAAYGDVQGFARIATSDGTVLGQVGPPKYGGVFIDAEQSPWQLAEGKPPASGSEVVIDRRSAKEGTVKVGDNAYAYAGVSGEARTGQTLYGGNIGLRMAF